MKGIVLNFNRDRGIGTILGDDGTHYFVHFSNIKKRVQKILFPKEHDFSQSTNVDKFQNRKYYYNFTIKCTY